MICLALFWHVVSLLIPNSTFARKLTASKPPAACSIPHGRCKRHHIDSGALITVAEEPDSSGSIFSLLSCYLARHGSHDPAYGPYAMLPSHSTHHRRAGMFELASLLISRPCGFSSIWISR